MSRFLTLAIFLIAGAGLAIHSGVHFPWFAEWFGSLPGDIVIKREGVIFYLPVASSLLVSALLSAILSLFSKN